MSEKKKFPCRVVAEKGNQDKKWTQKRWKLKRKRDNEREIKANPWNVSIFMLEFNLMTSFIVSAWFFSTQFILQRWSIKHQMKT